MADLKLSHPVLVTGGASGLGRAVVAALRQAAATPVSLDARELPGPDSAGSDRPDRPVDPSGPAEHRVVDVADTAAAHRAVTEVAERYGGLSGVFTAAGIDRCGPLDEVPREDWERVVAVNLLGTAAVVRAALPFLRRTRGRVVTCASTLGMRVAGDATAYCASKFGVVGFTRALAEELKGQVGVTLLVPGGMRTAFFDDREPKYQPGPDAKLTRPEDVARAIVFALGQPAGCEVRELVITSSEEVSWP